jgi:Mrp family chromosome partitioning ATPase
MDALTTLQLDDPGEYVRLIAAAEVPRQPSSPRTMLLLVVGTLLGLLAGGGSAFARGRLDDRVHDSEDLASEALPVIGLLPDISKVRKELFGRKPTVVAAGRALDTGLVTVLAPRSPEAAMFRKFATRIAATTPTGSVLMFTSAEAGAGKSLTVANTASALVLAGHRVLLIDADMYRMAQRAMLGFSPGAFLDVETGAFPSGGGLESRDGALRLLYGVLLSSRRPIATEHAAVRALAGLVAHYRAHFDYIVIDSPPIMATSFATAASTVADRRYVVVASGSSRVDVVRQATTELAAADCPATGYVITRFDAAASPAYRTAYDEIRGYYAGQEA